MSWLKDFDDYQRDAVDRMKNGCILCGGVGSGKSKTALAYYFKEMGGDIDSDHYVPMDDVGIKDLYIITTARKRDTFEWEDELVPFLMYPNKDDCHDTHSVDGDRTNLYSNKIVIDSWNNIQKYKHVIGAFFIFDEQRVVGSGAWVKAFLKIARGNRWVLLTGTPGDTWTDYIPVFVANGFYHNKTEFMRKHAVYNRYANFPKVDRFTGTGKLLKYRRQILVDMDYHKSTIRHDETVGVNYDITAYKNLIRTRWNPFDDEPIENPGEFCYLQRKIVNSDPSRQIALLEILEDHPKVIVFYNFDYELEILRGLLSDNGIVFAEWNGHRHELVPTGDRWCYLVQYNAGAEAWNCIATDTMVFYSQTYSYKMFEQSHGRIDRRNTPFVDLWYYNFRSKSGIDLAISRALAEKRDFNYLSYSRRYNFFREEKK